MFLREVSCYLTVWKSGIALFITAYLLVHLCLTEQVCAPHELLPISYNFELTILNWAVNGDILKITLKN